MKAEYRLIHQWIEPNSRVLDLGCGTGDLLKDLQTHKNIQGYGLEINPERITACIKNGVNVIEQNLDDGLANFKDNSFDVIVMSQALQMVKHPDILLREMLRVARSCIVTFPNFGHWTTRTYLTFKGRMPVSKVLPYYWYNTPNIHLCTFKDFEAFCQNERINICDRTVVDSSGKDNWFIRRMPNLFGEIAIYRVSSSQ